MPAQEYYECDLPKPLGVRFARGNDGGCYIVGVDAKKGSVTDDMQPGDKVSRGSGETGGGEGRGSVGEWEEREFGTGGRAGDRKGDGRGTGRGTGAGAGGGSLGSAEGPGARAARSAAVEAPPPLGQRGVNRPRPHPPPPTRRSSRCRRRSAATCGTPSTTAR